MRKNYGRTQAQRRTFGHIIHDSTRNVYEGKVIAESLKRAGKNPQIKGIIHEHMIKDSINYNPGNIAKGVKASLTKNPNAKTVDIVVTRGNKIVSRIQAKDTANSIGKTVKQIKSGQYNSARIVGTKETVAKLNTKLAQEGIKKTATSSGVSSEMTNALAVKAGVNAFKGLGKACVATAKSNAITGAIISGGIAVVYGAIALKKKKKKLGQVLLDVGKETAGGGVSAAGAGVASTVTGAGVATLASAIGITGGAATAMTVGLPIVVALGAGMLIKYGWDKAVSPKRKAEHARQNEGKDGALEPIPALEPAEKSARKRRPKKGDDMLYECYL